MKNKFSAFVKLSVQMVAVCSIAYPYHANGESRYICATVSKYVEPSEDSAYFKVAGDFTLQGNKEKILGYYMWGDKKKRDRDMALIDTSLKKKKKVYILIDDNGIVEEVKSECPVTKAKTDYYYVDLGTAGGGMVCMSKKDLHERYPTETDKEFYENVTSGIYSPNREECSTEAKVRANKREAEKNISR